MTGKQEIATTILMNSGGKKPVSQAMIEAGYSPATANRPKVLTESKAYIQAMAKLKKKHGVTLDKYMRNVGQAMDATKTIVTKDGDVVAELPDHAIRLAGNKQAEKLLNLSSTSDGGSVVDPADLEALAGVSDEIELTKVLFRRNS